MAYMYTQKLKDLIKKEMEGKADQDFKEFLRRSNHVLMRFR